MEAKVKKADEIILELLQQSCGDYDREKGTYTYDTMYISTYSDAAYYLIEKGIIKKEQVTR